MNVFSSTNTQNMAPILDGALEVQNLRAMLSVACEWYWHTDSELNVKWLSRGAIDKTGILSSDMVGKKWWESKSLVPAFNAHWDQLREAMNSKKAFQDFVVCYINVRQELVCLSLSGSPVFGDDGLFLGYSGIANNLTEYQRQGKGILRLLRFDPLTGYANWKTMEETFEHGMVVAQRKGKSLGFLLLQCPDIQNIANAHPLSVSSQLFQSVCARIERHLRKGDLISRVGLNEIGVILQEIVQVSDLEKIVEKIHVALVAPFMVGDSDKVLDFRATFLIAPEHGDNLEAIIKLGRNNLLLPSHTIPIAQP